MTSNVWLRTSTDVWRQSGTGNFEQSRHAASQGNVIHIADVSGDGVHARRGPRGKAACGQGAPAQVWVVPGRALHPPGRRTRPCLPAQQAHRVVRLQAGQRAAGPHWTRRQDSGLWAGQDLGVHVCHGLRGARTSGSLACLPLQRDPHLAEGL